MFKPSKKCTYLFLKRFYNNSDQISLEDASVKLKALVREYLFSMDVEMLKVEIMRSKIIDKDTKFLTWIKRGLLNRIRPNKDIGKHSISYYDGFFDLLAYEFYLWVKKNLVEAKNDYLEFIEGDGIYRNHVIEELGEG